MMSSHTCSAHEVWSVTAENSFHCPKLYTCLCTYTNTLDGPLVGFFISLCLLLLYHFVVLAIHLALSSHSDTHICARTHARTHTHTHTHTHTCVHHINKSLLVISPSWCLVNCNCIMWIGPSSSRGGLSEPKSPLNTILWGEREIGREKERERERENERERDMELS